MATSARTWPPHQWLCSGRQPGHFLQANVKPIAPLAIPFFHLLKDGFEVGVAKEAIVVFGIGPASFNNASNTVEARSPPDYTYRDVQRSIRTTVLEFVRKECLQLIEISIAERHSPRWETFKIPEAFKVPIVGCRSWLRLVRTMSKSK